MRDIEVHEPDKRHKCVDKQAHHCEVRRIQKRMYVDPAGIDRKPARMTGWTGYLPYRGRSLYPRVGKREKSAEVIVVAGTRAQNRNLGGLTKP